MSSSKMKLEKLDYGKFHVHFLDQAHTFVHINIKSPDDFYKEVAAYILDEGRLVQYIKNKKTIQFTPTKKNQVAIIKRLNLFLDDEILDIPINLVDLESILHDEFDTYTDPNGDLRVRLSKIGRIGEYIFHILLSEFFCFDCIIPKVALTTDKNMSVFGIDELFYDGKNEMLLFGESKVTKNLENGIALIKTSLKDYEKQIRDEFRLCMSEELISRANLPPAFVEHIENALTFEQFISLSGTKVIGIPLFICHGDEIDPELILTTVCKKITQTPLFGLDTRYYILSLPVISKVKFLTYLTAAIKAKSDKMVAEIE